MPNRIDAVVLRRAIAANMRPCRRFWTSDPQRHHRDDPSIRLTRHHGNLWQPSACPRPMAPIVGPSSCQAPHREHPMTVFVVAFLRFVVCMLVARVLARRGVTGFA